EVRVDRADGQARLPDDVLHRGPMEAALAEDLQRRPDDPVADLLLVFLADSGHDTPGERLIGKTSHLVRGRQVLTKRMLILYGRRDINETAGRRRGPRLRTEPSDAVLPLGCLRLPVPEADRAGHDRPRGPVRLAGVAGDRRPDLRRLDGPGFRIGDRCDAARR